jgi:terminal uridylyltransferase
MVATNGDSAAPFDAIEVIMEISTRERKNPFYSLLRCQHNTEEWTAACETACARTWVEPSARFPEEGEEVMTLLLRRATLGPGSARYCSCLLIWTLEQKDWPYPRVDWLYSNIIESIDALLRSASTDRAQCLGIFTAQLLSYANSLARDPQAFHAVVHDNFSFACNTSDAKPLGFEAWRKLRMEWESKLQSIALSLLPAEAGSTDQPHFPAAEAWAKELVGLFPRTREQWITMDEAVPGFFQCPQGEDPDTTQPFCPLSCEGFSAPVVVMPSGYSFEAAMLADFVEIAPSIRDKLAESRSWGKARTMATSPALTALLNAIDEPRGLTERTNKALAAVPESGLLELCSEGKVKSIHQVLRCPRTNVLMVDPVVDADGITHENDAIGDTPRLPNLSLRMMLSRLAELGVSPEAPPELKAEVDAWEERVRVRAGEKFEKLDSHSVIKAEAVQGEMTKVARSFLKDRKVSTIPHTVADLMDVLGELLPTIKFDVFGSAMNGFGDDEADIDLSASYVNGGDTEDKRKVLEIIWKALNNCHRVERDSITAVLSARVPVLKFLFRKKDKSTVEVDICVANTLGVANTQLLAKYASLDERVASLGRTVKAWAKKSRIVGTQDGMLNSYTFVLMVLDYLQNCDPPVIPSLQDPEDSTLEPTLVVEGGRQHNISFLTEVDWVKKNTLSLGDLCAGFFDYFGRDFDWSTRVVTIRRRSKERTPNQAASPGEWVIEDPFETWRNMAQQCTDHGRSQMTLAFRHAITMARAPLRSLQDLCPPRASFERYFIRVPLPQGRNQDDGVGIWLLHVLRKIGKNAPPNFVMCEMGSPTFKKDLFFEFPTKQARYEGMSVAHQASKGQYSFFVVGADFFLHTLGEATSVQTRMSY